MIYWEAVTEGVGHLRQTPKRLDRFELSPKPGLCLGILAHEEELRKEDLEPLGLGKPAAKRRLPPQVTAVLFSIEFSCFWAVDVGTLI